MNGSVTISLDDFTSLLESSKESSAVLDKTKLATKELQVFLTFLCTREDISKYVDEFNKQSKTSEIVLSNSMAQIKFKDDYNNFLTSQITSVLSSWPPREARFFSSKEKDKLLMRTLCNLSLCII